jgi:hypothetical protein
VAFAVATQ